MTDDLKSRLCKFEGGDKYGSTVWHRNPDGPEAVEYIEKLEEENGVLFAANVQLNSRADLDSDGYADRIEKLDAALRHCINALKQYEMGDERPRGPAGPVRPWLLGAMDNAIQALEGKDD